jgi:hypothetical protein
MGVSYEKHKKLMALRELLLITAVAGGVRVNNQLNGSIKLMQDNKVNCVDLVNLTIDQTTVTTLKAQAGASK